MLRHRVTTILAGAIYIHGAITKRIITGVTGQPLILDPSYIIQLVYLVESIPKHIKTYTNMYSDFLFQKVGGALKR